MELEDDNLGTMIAIYYLPEMENPSPVELFSEIAELESVQVITLVNIGDEGPGEGKDVHPYLAGNKGSSIVICNNPGAFMTDVDLDASLAHDFYEYPDIMSAYLLDEE
ncbi:hypothetical protein GOBAR_AA18022 [Gossypium barbadense]|uniref:Uncharacterized protein n=1 Tax=Gossypium barbadense TaxID=3634 RepID=A0A2P5XH12_GOSBA|nr:hypothetical protein GOBAR_AA18022 [Gossypium barbadense]